MTGIFTPRHLFLVNRLQHRGIAFHLEESLTQPYHPLRAALAAFFTVGELGALTYVVREGDNQAEGFVQMRERRARPEADILFMAPLLSDLSEADVWLRLLTGMVHEAGKRGVERLYACLPGGGEEVSLFGQVGFNVFSREDVFCLNGANTFQIQTASEATVRPYDLQDIVGVQQLYAAVASKQVQQAENFAGRGPFCPLSVGRHDNNNRSFVLEKEREIVGCLTLRLGQTGHWMYVLLHPQAYDLAIHLLNCGLDTLVEAPTAPVYCGVRDFQGGLRAVLQDTGFEHLLSRVFVVKHTAVRMLDVVRAVRPALEKRAEVTTPTVSPANGRQASHHTESV
ncbi:MAG: hypothetical protein ACOYZ7_02600 [Chloroflexota bacterium]